jgi:hypothetical protein
MRATVPQQGHSIDLALQGEPASRAWARNVAPGALGVDKLAFEYLETGIELFLVDPEIMWPIGWDGDAGYDHRHYELHLDRLLDVKPDLKMVLFTGIGQGVPYRWARNHTDQLARLDNGDVIKMPSMASQQWRLDFGRALRHFVHHFETSRFADHIIGYNPIRNANEWFGYDMSKQIRPQTGMGKFADYSQPMVEHFRRWLRDRYAGDEAALQSAWKDDTVTFETAEVPSPERRVRSGHEGTFLTDGPHGAHVPDWYRCYNQSNTRDAINTCRSIKEALRELGREKLVGLMHGYCEIRDNGVPQEFGHFNGHELIESEWADFHHGPHSYHNRQPGLGVHLAKYPVDALAARGKLYIDQFDFQTHHFPKHSPRPPVTPEQSINRMKRGLGFTLQHNVSFYFHEGGPGSYDAASAFAPAEWSRLHFDDPIYTDAIRRVKAVADENQTLGSVSAAEVAIIHAPTGYHHVNPFVSTAVTSFCTSGVRSFAMPAAGTPFDEYFLEDFAAIKRSYKLYLFPAAFDVTPEQREAIHAQLAAEGATAVWTYAPGRYADGRLAPDGPSKLTGFRLAELAGPMHAQCEVRPHDRWLPTLDRPMSYGTREPWEKYTAGCDWWDWPKDHRFAQVFHPEPDDEVTVLGQLEGTDHPGLAVRQHAGITSMYAAVPLLEPRVLAAIYRAAGVHVYGLDGDLVYASDRFVTIHARAAGDRRLMLRKPASVVDAFTREPVAVEGRTITLPMTFAETRILKLQ